MPWSCWVAEVSVGRDVRSIFAVRKLGSMTTTTPAKKTTSRRKPAAKKAAKAPYSKETYIKWHRDMLLMRRFEERCGQHEASSGEPPMTARMSPAHRNPASLSHRTPKQATCTMPIPTIGSRKLLSTGARRCVAIPESIITNCPRIRIANIGCQQVRRTARRLEWHCGSRANRHVGRDHLHSLRFSRARREGDLHCEH